MQVEIRCFCKPEGDADHVKAAWVCMGSKINPIHMNDNKNGKVLTQLPQNGLFDK